MRTLSFLIVFLLTLPAYAETFYTVTRVIDGDTVVLNDGQKVRLIGVDCPESYPSKKLKKDAERSKQDVETIKALGRRATAFTRGLVEGQRVTLEHDQTLKDRYGRTLAYLRLEDGRNVNLEIIREGYGVAYTSYPFKYMESFRGAEREAREAKKGLWGK